MAKRTRESFLWLNYSFFDNYLKKIQPSSVLVYMAMCRMADNETQTCFPSMETLSEKTGVARSTVALCVKELSDIGLIDWKRTGRSNRYQLLETMSEIRTSQNETMSEIQSSEVRNPGDLMSDQSDSNKTKEQDSLILSPPASETTIVKPKKEPDPRHQPFRKTLEKFWTHQNPNTPIPNWGVADAGQLGKFLKDWPTIDRETFTQWLRNYDASDEIKTTLRPYQLLPRLHEYASGPLNKFGKPQEGLHASA